MIPPRKSKHVISDATRKAAILARKMKALIPVDKTRPDVYVVRHTEGPASFRWEIRRFGHVVLQKGSDIHISIAEARSAGEVALALLQETATIEKRKNRP